MMILYLTWDIFIVHMSLFGTTECLRKGFHNVQIVPTILSLHHSSQPHDKEKHG